MRSSLLVLLLAACGGASGPGAPPDPMRAPLPLRVPLGDSPQRGPSDAWVTIVEFADFECPYSGDEESVLQTLLYDLPAEVRLIYKYFPLYPLHPDSRTAAVAAECARIQGSAPDGFFWEMHDLLFQNQADLSGPALLSYAGQIPGLDLSAWSACTMTQPPLALVLADEALGTTFSVIRTPTFAVNGKPVEGAYTSAAFGAVVDAALAEARASGIRSDVYYQQVVLGP